MATEVCEKCRRLFSGTGRTVCPECLEETRKIEDKLFDYLDQQHSVVTLEQLHQETGVPLQVIVDMYKHGAFLHRYKVATACDLCHEPIFQGKICSNCAAGISGDLQGKAYETKVAEAKQQAERESKPAAKTRFYSGNR